MKVAANGFLVERYDSAGEVEVKPVAKVLEEVKEAKKDSKSSFGTGFG